MAGADRRASFLEAAATLVVERGPSAVTMEEIAARVGVNKRLGYRYFANREDVLRQLLESEMEEMRRRVSTRLPPDASLRQNVAVSARAWIDLVAERGPLLTRLLSEQDAVITIAREMNERATSDWGEALQQGLGISPRRARVLAKIYLAALRGATAAVEGGIADVDEVAKVFVAVAQAGADAVSALPD